MEKMRGNGYKLLLGIFCLDSRGKFFTMRTIRHWINLPRKVMNPQHDWGIWLNMMLGHLVYTVLLPGKLGQMILELPFQSYMIILYNRQ